eukprot:TRINITY_DN1748_c0_g1_i1.p3 TRINITY_DN1748_c0_g1~~TRINITY_DN1748_c0_g1_i1.p3  ORF type:complete len:477 (-),score=54.39 TRINITY_DN1748_c0_g1_i1:7589-9019(-)
MIFETVKVAQSPVHKLLRRGLSTEQFSKDLTTEYSMSTKAVQMEPNVVTKNMNYEATVACKYKHLKGLLDKKKKQISALTCEKNSMLKNIAQVKERIRELKVTDYELASGGTTGRAFHKISSSTMNSLKVAELSIAQAKIKRRNMINTYNEQIAEVRKELLTKEAALQELNEKVTSIKFELARLREEQSEYYHKLLAEGMDTRQEGLSWIFKAIWSLGKNVNLSKLPIYLDEKAVEYLLEFSRKDMELDNLKEKATKLYNKYKEEGEDNIEIIDQSQIGSEEDHTQTKENEAAELEKEMESHRKAIKELREREYKRITRDFLGNNCGLKYKVSLVTILCALFGYDFMLREIDKFPSAKAVLRARSSANSGAVTARASKRLFTQYIKLHVSVMQTQCQIIMKKKANIKYIKRKDAIQIQEQPNRGRRQYFPRQNCSRTQKCRCMEQRLGFPCCRQYFFLFSFPERTITEKQQVRIRY